MTAGSVHTRHVVVMGVSGCGKSTIARALAERRGASFGEADLLHPATNIAKMSAGVALTDDDRWPWLDLVAAWISREKTAGRPTIVSCSALKRRYRDRLREVHGDVAFVHLAGPRATILARMQLRAGHFMPAGLLDSQLADLEPLQADECGVTVDLTAPQHIVVSTACRWLGDGHTTMQFACPETTDPAVATRN